MATCAATVVSNRAPDVVRVTHTRGAPSRVAAGGVWRRVSASCGPPSRWFSTASVQHPNHGSQRESFDCAWAGTATSANARTSRADLMLAPSEDDIYAAREPEPGQVNRLEPHPVQSQLGVRPQVARVHSGIHALEDAHVNAAEGLCTRRPAVRFESIAENGEIDEVDEITELFQGVVHGAGATADKRHHLGRDPGALAQRTAALGKRVAKTCPEVDLPERCRLFDGQ